MQKALLDTTGERFRPGTPSLVSLHPREIVFVTARRTRFGRSTDTSRRALDALNLENFGINYGALYRICLARISLKLPRVATIELSAVATSCTD